MSLSFAGRVWQLDQDQAKLADWYAENQPNVITLLENVLKDMGRTGVIPPGLDSRVIALMANLALVKLVELDVTAQTQARNSGN